MSGRLVAISNRVSIPRKASAPGGLAVGLLAAMRSRGGLWFGWSGELVDGEPGETDLVKRAGVTYAVTDMRRSQFEDYYYGFSNGVLWPLFHYFLETFRYTDGYYEAYLEANRFLADRLRALLEPGDLLWVHDFHLIPIARLLRENGLPSPIGFFLHTPFPHYEVLRALPVYAELLRDLCDYDVVGFQTANDLNSFRDSIGYVWGEEALREPDYVHVEGRRTNRYEDHPTVASLEAALNGDSDVKAEAVGDLLPDAGTSAYLVGGRARGPVVEGRPAGEPLPPPNVAVLPTGPRSGDDPVAIVEGFLSSMASYEPGYPTAREYLTPTAAAGWEPE